MRLIIPDVHLGLVYDGLDRTPDIQNILNEILKLNIGSSIDQILWLGDIFHSPHVSHSLISWFMDYLQATKDGMNCENVILCGNHDGYTESKKGSPLEEIEASNLATVHFKPAYAPSRLEVYFPYCKQELIDTFCNELLSKGEKLVTAFCHTDLIDVIPGIESSIGIGSGCILPKEIYPLFDKVIAGHIHTPQVINNLVIAGSLLQADISEPPEKFYFTQHADYLNYHEIESRKIVNFDIDYPKDKDLLDELQNGSKFNKEDIVSVRITCIENKAHELNQPSIKDNIRNNCYHLRFTCDIVRERHYRMKSLSTKDSDRDILKKFITQQKIENSNVILEEAIKIMDEVESE